MIYLESSLWLATRLQLLRIFYFTTSSFFSDNTSYLVLTRANCWTCLTQAVVYNIPHSNLGKPTKPAHSRRWPESHFFYARTQLESSKLLHYYYTKCSTNVV